MHFSKSKCQNLKPLILRENISYENLKLQIIWQKSTQNNLTEKMKIRFLKYFLLE
jgi:hypothetical protein